MLRVGEIFYLDNEYSKKADFCNKNALIIVEIEPDTKGRRFQIQKMPEPSIMELAKIQIRDKKATLEKYKEDVEQVELFGMQRDDYEIKKQMCVEIILELRKLEQLVING